MKRGQQGSAVPSNTTGDTFFAFVPAPLPPDPPLQLTAGLHDALEGANRALGKLDAVTILLPDPSIFLYLYVRKEAVLSSQIEGTQSSFADLLLFENEESPGVPLDDVSEVSRYVAALDHGVSRIRGGFPLSVRLFNEIHRVLLTDARGAERSPGEIRRTQNWIGQGPPSQAIFVPPPADKVRDCLSDLEKFLHDQPHRTPSLIKAALAHVQFETIHPYLDGNGRLGRLLISLILLVEGALTEPLLYLSLYFKQHRERYYDLLQKARTEGDWEAWLSFFLLGIKEVAGKASDTARHLIQLFEADREKIQEQLGRSAGSALRVHYHMRRNPVTGSPPISEALGLSPPTVNTALKNLGDLGIVQEITGKDRNRLYMYSGSIALMSEGTELPGRQGQQ